MINPDNYYQYHKEISVLLRFPPFSTQRNEDGDWELAEEAKEDMNTYLSEVIKPVAKNQNPDWELEGEPFEEFREKWKEELEEAELYQARYGDDFAAAAKAASGDE